MLEIRDNSEIIGRAAEIIMGVFEIIISGILKVFGFLLITAIVIGIGYAFFNAVGAGMGVIIILLFAILTKR